MAAVAEKGAASAVGAIAAVMAPSREGVAADAPARSEPMKLEPTAVAGRDGTPSRTAPPALSVVERTPSPSEDSSPSADGHAPHAKEASPASHLARRSTRAAAASPAAVAPPAADGEASLQITPRGRKRKTPPQALSSPMPKSIGGGRGGARTSAEAKDSAVGAPGVALEPDRMSEADGDGNDLALALDADHADGPKHSSSSSSSSICTVEARGWSGAVADDAAGTVGADGGGADSGTARSLSVPTSWPRLSVDLPPQQRFKEGDGYGGVEDGLAPMDGGALSAEVH